MHNESNYNFHTTIKHLADKFEASEFQCYMDKNMDKNVKKKQKCKITIIIM